MYIKMKIYQNIGLLLLLKVSRLRVKLLIFALGGTWYYVIIYYKVSTTST
jgi:hypothetical protein